MTDLTAIPEVIKQSLVASTQVPYGYKLVPLEVTCEIKDAIVGNLLREGINKHRARELTDHFINLIISPEQITDPCPGCTPGHVCRTPACGRLQLPQNHPLRNTQ